MNEFQKLYITSWKTIYETIDNITNEIEDEKFGEEYLREGEQNSHRGPNKWN